MNSLPTNIQAMSYEDLEKRSAEIHKRMQMIHRSGQHNPLVWQQLQAYLEEINQEKQERAGKLNTLVKNMQSGVVINTDPLDDDQPNDTGVISTSKGFNPIS
jgi:uncharacterized membrane protein